MENQSTQTEVPQVEVELARLAEAQMQALREAYDAATPEIQAQIISSLNMG
jgi:hypothetical protein